MEASSHRKLVVWVFGAALAVLVLMAAAAAAWAQAPIVSTEVTRYPTETFSDESTRCQTELYSTTFSGGQSVVHLTYFEDTGALHFHEWSHGKIVAVPLDGTGPSYTGHFRFGQSLTFRNVKGGELVGVHTDLDRFVARGSDGSRAFFKLHEHFTVNANGVKTVDFEGSRLVCT